MSFSSFPGGIQSGDDFYLISSGLVTMETTNENYNESLWSDVKPVGQVIMFKLKIFVFNCFRPLPIRSVFQNSDFRQQNP